MYICRVFFIFVKINVRIADKDTEIGGYFVPQVTLVGYDDISLPNGIRLLNSIIIVFAMCRAHVYYLINSKFVVVPSTLKTLCPFARKGMHASYGITNHEFTSLLPLHLAEAIVLSVLLLLPVTGGLIFCVLRSLHSCTRWDNTTGVSAEKHLANLKNFNDTRNFGGGQRLCVGELPCCVVARVGVVWCGVVWCGVVWCGVVWCGVIYMMLISGPQLACCCA
jgi:hypothetical protein